MTDKKPGIVIFVSILHWLSVALFGLLSFFCLAALLFSHTLNLDRYFMDRISQISPPSFSYGPVFVLAVLLFLLLCFTSFFLALAIGLLKGKKFAWYMQVAFSTLGLLGLPLGFLGILPLLPLAALNIVILVFFFSSRVREHFKV